MGRDPITTIKNWKPDDIANLPPGARAIVGEIQQTLKHSLKDEEFLEFTRTYPINSRWVSKQQGSNLRIRIIAVDHRWNGPPKPETVVITFKHTESNHRFHWPVKIFAQYWVPDPETDF